MLPIPSCSKAQSFGKIAAIFFLSCSFSLQAFGQNVAGYKLRYQNCKGPSYDYPDVIAGWTQEHGPFGEVMLSRQGMNSTNNCFDAYLRACPEGTVLHEYNRYNSPICRAAEIDIEKDNGPSCNLEGNPINIATGNKYQHEVDFRGVGPSPLAIERHYNSTDQQLGPFGVGWRWKALTSLELDGSAATDLITLRLGDGRVLEFAKVDQNWVADKDVRRKLVEVAAGHGYVLSSPDGSSSEFSQDGRLLSQTNKAGRKTVYEYDSSDRLLSIRSHFGKMLSINYTNNDLIGRIQYSPGISWDYEYDTANRLFKVTNPDGASRTYLYENSEHPNALTGIKDETEKRYATYRYDGDGRAIESSHAGETGRYHFSYDSLLKSTVTNPLGKKTTYKYELIEGVKRPVSVEGHQSANCASASQFYEYDNSGRVIKKTGWDGVVTTFDRNERGFVINRVEAEGTSSQRVINTDWHPLYELPAQITNEKRDRSLTYNDSGLIVKRVDRQSP